MISGHERLLNERQSSLDVLRCARPSRCCIILSSAAIPGTSMMDRQSTSHASYSCGIQRVWFVHRHKQFRCPSRPHLCTSREQARSAVRSLFCATPKPKANISARATAATAFSGSKSIACIMISRRRCTPRLTRISVPAISGNSVMDRQSTSHACYSCGIQRVWFVLLPRLHAVHAGIVSGSALDDSCQVS